MDVARSPATPAEYLQGAPLSITADNLDHEYLQHLVSSARDEGFLSVAIAVRSPRGRVVGAYCGEAFAQGSATNGRERLYTAGSQAKLLTACALAILVRRKLISLGDKASRYIRVPGTDLQRTTIADLLSHKPGLGDFLPEILADQSRGLWDNYSALELVQFAGRAQPAQSAGRDFAYCNTNYVVLSLIFEAVTGQPLSASLDELFFQPLGMRSAHCGAAGIRDREKIAKGYLGTSESPRDLDMTSVRDLSIATGAGDLIWNLDDAVTFASAMLDDRMDMVPGLQCLLVTPRSIGSNNDWIGPDYYAYGVEGFDTGNGYIWGHRGFIWGTASATFIDPERRLIMSGFATHCDEIRGRIPRSKRLALRKLFLSPFIQPQRIGG